MFGKKIIVGLLEGGFSPSLHVSEHIGINPSMFAKNKKKEIITESGYLLNLASVERYYHLEELDEPVVSSHRFTLEELMPRDHKVFSNTEDRVRAAACARQLVLIYRWWSEKRLPLFARALVDHFRVDMEDIKAGKYQVIMRISQSEDNVVNKNYFTTSQLQNVLLSLKRIGVLEDADGVWSCFRYSPRQKDTCFAKGYVVDMPLLMSYLGAIRNLIVEPYKERFGDDLTRMVRGDADISGMPFSEMIQAMEDYKRASKNGTRKPNWKRLSDTRGLTAVKYAAIATYLANIPEGLMDYLKNLENQKSFDFRFLERLQTSVVENKLIEIYNEGKDTFHPNKLPEIRRAGGYVSDQPQFRAYSDICSLPKMDGEYKGRKYGNRIELFKDFGFEDPKEYDCANSVHADNCYLMTGKWLEGDLYTELLPPLLEKNLRANKEWMKQWDGIREEIREDLLQYFFHEIFKDRSAIKTLCNVFFAGGTAGSFWKYLNSRMVRDQGDVETRKHYLKIYAEVFAETYNSICGKSLRNYIYNVESFKMLWIAMKMKQDGYDVALIYDCFITDKPVDREMMTYLYRTAMEEYYDLNRNTILFYREAL